MNVSIIHPTLKAVGGSEQVCINMLESMQQAGYKITLGTFEKTDWQLIEKYFGKVLQPDFEVVGPRRFSISAYGELLNFRSLSSKMPKDSEVLLVSCTSPWFYPPQAKALAVYVLPPLRYGEGFWRMYLEPYKLTQRMLLSRIKNKLLLTNSSFSADIIEDAYSFRPTVLYPPVNTGAFYSSKKEDLVVAVGRFDPSKRFEILIEAFREIKDAECIIMGSVAADIGNKSQLYINRLEHMINDYGLSNRVKLMVNCEFKLLIKTMSKAKIYVHCFENEPFGISVAESMAAGCVPIVHRSGGAYHDIIGHDKFGFSFNTVDELREKINFLLENTQLASEYKLKGTRRAKDFSEQIFKSNIAEIVEKISEL